MTTPKWMRQPPARTFENYTFVRIVGTSEGGLARVSTNAMLPCSPAQAGDNPGTGWADNGYSVPLPIGFNFSFDGRTYSSFAASTNGWMALIDPALGTFASTEVISGSSSKNGNILSTFTSNAVLLAPWFDDLRNVASDLQQITGSYSATKLSRVRGGLEPPVTEFNPAQFGVKYITDVRSRKGRRLIVRWNSVSNSSTTNTTLRFDAVLYENGDIEFRYAPRQSLTMVNNGSTESATIGIFMPSGTQRFRDMSAGLGYKDAFRTVYKYGGYVSSSAFSDTVDGNSVAYAGGLTPSANWPSTWSSACTMAFRAPTLRREVLPRLEVGRQGSQSSMPTVGRSGDAERIGTAPIMYDDRSAVSFGGTTVVNYPTTLPRLFGGPTRSTDLRQNLFFNDFEVTGSISKAASDEYLIQKPQAYIAPFSDNRRPALVVNSVNGYFATGSSLVEFSNHLSRKLTSKTQIRMTLPVERTITLPTASCATFYYRPTSRSWALPANSSYVIGSNASTNNSGVSKGDLTSPLVDFNASRGVAEDFRGFGPIGNRVSSGSLINTAGAGQTDVHIGETFDRTTLIPEVSTLYGKSVSNHADYAATSDETFSLPIAKAFLIEKAVVEIPFAMGDGWFKNLTTSFIPCPLADSPVFGPFDFAGPALTFALYNQVKAGSKTRLDLIMSGTVTHSFDNNASVVTSLFTPESNGTVWLGRPVGYTAYDQSPGAIVTPVSTSNGYTFTGSVQLNCQAATSTGVIAGTILSTLLFDGSKGKASGIRQVLASPTIAPTTGSVASSYTQSTIATNINPYSRGATGFATSFRSTFGKEYHAFDASLFQPGVANPFYFSGSNPNVTGSSSGLPAQLETVLADVDAGNRYLKLVAALPIIKHRPSPYIVRPGDKLVLALSKCRPVCYTTNSGSFASGSISDDVQLITGSVNIVFYGSEVAQGAEHHDVVNQALDSDAVHEMLSADQTVVLDQFYGDYRDAFSGSWTDEVVMGSLTNTLLWNGTTGSLGRGVAFSKSAPRSASWSPGVGPYDTNISFSYQLQPYYELSGFSGLSSAVTTTERIWDSMMPAIDQCFAADGCGIFLRDQSISPLNNTDLNFVDPTSVDVTRGFIWFDYVVSSVYTQMQTLVNGNWTWAYPFEPRYAAVGRQQDVAKSFNAQYIIKGGTPNVPNPTVTSITPTATPSIMFGPVGAQRPSVPRVLPTDTSTNSFRSHWVSDVLTGQYNSVGITLGQFHTATGSAGTVDIVKALYGFGDLNNIIFPGTSNYVSLGLRFGTNHFADARQYKNDSYGSSYGYGSNYAFSPIIRGWKYGVYSGLPSFTKAIWRGNRYGQPRDMLEQRLYTKVYNSTDVDLPTNNTQQGVTLGVVSVKFVDAFGNLTKPENTWSSNLSLEATSSMPFFDGLALNRPTINTRTLNVGVLNVTSQQFNNIVL